jgi:hypothetical protein
MKLDARDGAALNGGNDTAVMVGDGRNDVVVRRLDRVAVGEVDVLPVETRGDGRALCDLELVPAHVRDSARTDPAHGPGEDPEPASTLLARTEEELHADTDPEQRPTGCDTIAKRIVESCRLEPARSAFDVTDARDHRERRAPHNCGVGRDRRLGARAGEP